MTSLTHSARRSRFLHNWLSGSDGALLIAAGAFVLAYLAWLPVGRQLTGHVTLVNDLSYVAVGLVAVAMAWRASKHPALGPGSRRAWRLIAISLGCYEAGSVCWAYQELVLGALPFPSWADVGYVAFYPLCLAGLLCFPFAFGSRAERHRFVLDAGVVLLGGGMVVSYLLLGQLGGQPDDATVLALAYPTGDLVLLFAAATLALRRVEEHSRGSVRLLAAGLFLLVVGDLLFGYLSLRGAYQTPGWPDPAWMSGRFVLLLAAHVQYRAASLKPTERASEVSEGPSVSLLPYLSVALGFGLLIAVGRDRWEGALGGILLGAVALTILVVVRQVLALRENARLVEKALRAERVAQQEALERGRSEARFRLAAESASDLVYEWEVPTGCVQWFGDVDAQLGYAPGGLPRTLQAWEELLHPDDHGRVMEGAYRHLDGGEPFREEYRIRHRDGHYLHWMDQGGAVRDEGGVPVRWIGACTDVTDRKLAEEALRESEERYALAARAANDGLWDWDLKAGQVYFSARWKEMAGHLEGEIGTRLEEWLERLHPEDAELVRAAVDAHVQGRTSHLECEYRLRRKDGGYRWMLTRGLAVRDAEGHAVRIAGSQADVTDRKEAEEHLLHDALHDALTGLPNRLLFMDRLTSTLTRAKRRGDYPFAVLFLDLDRFKLVNDSLGHLAGDQLLIEIARRLQQCLRDGDTVARLGGDEFAILLDDVGGGTDADAIARRIHGELTRPFELDGDEIFTTASIGIALGSSECERAEELLRDADTAMYRAKALGKARHAVFDASMRDRAVALLTLETDLRRALERREFRLHYQPIQSLASGTVTGFEALVRWQHPTRGLVEPGQFIPLAEETGVIFPLGLWVLRSACRQLRTWQARYPSEPPLTMAVNLSARQCSQPELAQQVERILRETGIEPRSLKLEITEGAFMERAEAAGEVLEAIRALGVQLCLDDFGTGYSSLSYLRRLPVAALKIDRSFILRMGAGGEDLEIVRTIVALANNLGMDVIAEGVETVEQLDHVRTLSCQYAQGFHLSHPLERDRAEALLEERASAAATSAST